MIRLGVIGTGAWGLNHVRVIVGESRCELVGVADPDPNALVQVRSLAPNVRAFADPDQLLMDRDIDAVVISSPAATHAALASAAMARGKDVLVEKPLAMSVEDARRLAHEATQHGRIGMVGHLMVYHPAVLRLHSLLSSGALGRLHYLHSTRVNLGKIRRDENALWSFGPHDMSMIDFLLEHRTPESVAARGQCVLQPGVEDVVFITLRYGSGEMAHVHLSWLSPRKERRLTLVCSGKMAEFDDSAADKLRIYDKGYDRLRDFTEYAEFLTLRDGDVHIPNVTMQEPLRVQVRHFLDRIEDRRAPTTDFESGLRVIRVLEAGQRSLESDGVPVSVSA